MMDDNVRAWRTRQARGHVVDAANLLRPVAGDRSRAAAERLEVAVLIERLEDVAERLDLPLAG